MNAPFTLNIDLLTLVLGCNFKLAYHCAFFELSADFTRHTIYVIVQHLPHVVTVQVSYPSRWVRRGSFQQLACFCRGLSKLVLVFCNVHYFNIKYRLSFRAPCGQKTLSLKLVLTFKMTAFSS